MGRVRWREAGGICLLVWGLCVQPVAGLNKTWDGGGGDNNWQTGGNWDANTAPGATDVLFFGGTTRLNNTNNFSANTQFNGITFNSGAELFVLNGNAINLAGDIVNNDNSLQTINLALALTGSFQFNAASAGLTFGGGITSATAGTKTLTVTNANAVIISGIIGNGSGTMALSKTGTGGLTLSGNNTYSGGTTIGAGTVTLSHANALGTGGLTMNGGTLELLSGATHSQANLSGSGGTIRISGNNNTATLSVGSDNTSTTFGGNLAGTGNNNTDLMLVKTGTGTLTLSGTNNGSGGSGDVHLRIDSGALKVTGANSLGDGNLSLNGGVLGLGVANFTLGLGTGNGAFQFTGSGGFAAYTADRTVNIGNAGATMTWNSTANFLTTGNSLILGASDADRTVTFVNPLALNGAARTIQVDNGSATVDAIVSGILSGTGSSGLTKTGSGTLQLTVANSYSGATTINAGTLQLAGGNNRLPTGTAVTLADVAGATLDLNGQSQTIASLSGGGASGGNVSLGSGTLTNGDATSTTYAGVISGTGDLTKTGAGTLKLNGANTYTGTTAVNQGTLGGTGSIAGAVNVNSTGHLAPGNSIGTFATGALTLNAGSFYDVELGAPGTSDRTDVTGALTLGGTLSLTDAGGAGAGHYTIFTQTGLASGSFATINNLANLHGKVDTATSGSVFLDVFRLATATRSPATLNFANYHVGDISTDQGISVSNTAANDGFSEKLNATLSAPAGIVTSGSVSLLNPGATDNTSLNAHIDTSTAGSKAGTVTVNLASDGTGTSGYGTTALASQTVNVTGGSVYRLASANTLTTPVNVGNIHVGDSFGTQTLTVQNTAVNDAFSEKLNASFSTITGDASHNSATISLLNPGGSNNSSLSVGLAGANTATAGAKSGTVAVDFVTDGTGTSGLGLTPLASQTLTVNGGVYNLAATTFTGPTLTFGTYHVGDAVANQSLSIANTAPTGSFTEKLDASFGTPSNSGITTSGSISLLTPEASPSTAMSVGISTATAGSKSGTVDVNFTSDGTGTSGLGNTSLGAQTVTVSGDVFRLALANSLPATINLGSISIGGSFGTSALTLQNLAANDGFSEKLTVNFGLVTGDATHNGGGISLLAPAGTDNTSLVVGLGSANTSTPGLKTGTLTLNFLSDGFGTSGLGTTALASQLITIQGTVSSGESEWNFNGSGNWNDASKWTDGVPGSNPSDTATFGTMLSTVNGTVSLNGFSPTLSGMTFTNPTRNYLIAQGSSGTLNLNGAATVAVNAGSHTISAPIGGSGASLNKSGTGTLTLSGNNTYSGGTTISAGTVILGNTGALGTGGLTMSGGTLQFALDSSTISLASLAGTAGTINYTPGGNKPATLAVGSDNTSTTFAGILDDPGNGQRDLALVKNGTGTLTLSGANTHHGDTTVNAGVLNVQHNSALGDTEGGTIVASGAALELQNNVSITGEALTLNGTGIANGGALRNVSGNNTYSGAITLASVTRINSDTGLLTLNSAVPISGAFALSLGGAGNTAISSAITTGPLTKDGGGMLTLSGANAYAGTVTIDAGTLRLGANGVINDAGTVVVNGGGTFDLNGFNETIASLTGAGNVTLAGGTLTIANASDLIFAGQIINSNGGFTKQGAAKVTLNGAHSYSGTTHVQTGTLALGATASINSSSLIQVDGGSTLDVTAKGAPGFALSNGQTLEGSGLVLGNLTVGDGATISPGNSPGTLNIVGDETWATGGSYLWEINDALGTAGSDPGWDLQNISGTLFITATVTDPYVIDIESLTLADLPGAAAGFGTGYYNFKIASAGAVDGFAENKFHLDGSGFQNAPAGWTIFQQANEIWLQVAIVPEPASVALMIVGGLLVLAARRRF